MTSSRRGPPPATRPHPRAAASSAADRRVHAVPDRGAPRRRRRRRSAARATTSRGLWPRAASPTGHDEIHAYASRPRGDTAEDEGRELGDGRSPGLRGPRRARPCPAPRSRPCRRRRAAPAPGAERSRADGRRVPPHPARRGRHWGRRIFAVVALILLAALLYVVNATFQPFHGDAKGRVVVEIPAGADAGDRRCARGRGLIDSASSSSSRPRSAATAATCARAATCSSGHDQRRRDRRADEGPRGPAAGRDRRVTIVEARRGARTRPWSTTARRSRAATRAPRGPRRPYAPLRKLGAPKGTKSAEGFLFPATYELEEGSKRERARQAAARRVRDELLQGRLRAAKRKNLSRYDVLVIASMIEREVQLPPRRALVLGGHLQPPPAGDAVGDRRDHPLLDQQLETPDPPVRARQARTPTTRASTASSRRHRSATPAWRRSRPPPSRRTRATCSTCASPASPASTHSHRPTRSSSATPASATRPPAKARGPLKHSGPPTILSEPPDDPSRRVRLAGRTLALTADAQRGARRARPATTGATSCCRSRPSGSRRRSRRCRPPGFRGVNVTIPYKEQALALAQVR